MKQAFIRRGMRSNATARRLIADPWAAPVAPHVLRETIEYTVSKPVQPARMREESNILAGVPLFAGQKFYLVQSKFVGRCYIVARNRRTGEWVCSSKDAASLCIRKVQEAIAAGKQVAA